MNNYGRDDFWDAATWADLDRAVLEEVQRVRVAQQVFRTEDVAISTGTTPTWVSVAQIAGPTQVVPRLIPEGQAHPFVEISVPFWLTPAQAEAEVTLHTARTLARAAAKCVALAEDHIIFRGELANTSLGVVTTDTSHLVGLAAMNNPDGTPRLERLALAPRAKGTANDRAQALLDTVSDGVARLAANGWSSPYALILGPELYGDATSRLHPGSEETATDRLAPRLQHRVISGALGGETGILVSLAGDATTIYVAREASVAFSGEELTSSGAFYSFRVFERIQYAVRDPTSIRLIAP